MSCPICEKRKPSRFCPAKGESICAVCCGTGREVIIDCAPDCPHLLAAHRYEDEHPRALPADTPLLDVNLPGDTVHTHQQLMAALAFTIAKFCAAQREATDPDVLSAIQALAETYKTIKDSDIFYLLVFLYLMGLLRTNGRPRSRRYIEFLRGQFPQAQELKREESRIIVP